MLDKFRAASVHQQVQLAIGATLLATVVIVLLWFCLFRTTYAPLLSGLKVGDASAIVAEMDHRKIPYRLADGGTTILVPEGAVDSTRLALAGTDVAMKGTVGFELFNKADLGLTDFAQKINYQRALQGELERTIMTMDGVDTVRVHLSLGEDRLFRDDQVPPKASVTVRMTKGGHISEAFAQGIRRLIAAAVPKLEPADVVVLDEAGQSIGDPATAQPIAKLAPADDELQAVEQFYSARLREALEDLSIPGLAVTVSASRFGRISPGDWTPATRQFPLHITISSSASWTAEQQSKARDTITKAVSVPDQVDAIVFETNAEDLQTRPASHVAAPLRSSPVILPPEKDDQPFPGWLLVAIPGVVMILAAVLVLRRSRGPKPLDAKKRAEFADRLRTALEERDARAVSRS